MEPALESRLDQLARHQAELREMLAGSGLSAASGDAASRRHEQSVVPTTGLCDRTLGEIASQIQDSESCARGQGRLSQPR